MTKDTWAIIGTMVTIGSIIEALGGIAINQNSQLNTRINERWVMVRSRHGAAVRYGRIR